MCPLGWYFCSAFIYKTRLIIINEFHSHWKPYGVHDIPRISFSEWYIIGMMWYQDGVTYFIWQGELQTSQNVLTAISKVFFLFFFLIHCGQITSYINWWIFFFFQNSFLVFAQEIWLSVVIWVSVNPSYSLFIVKLADYGFHPSIYQHANGLPATRGLGELFRRMCHRKLSMLSS